MNDEILKECQRAKERLAVLFGDMDALMEFMMKRQEKRIKKGVKYADFSPYRKKKQETSDSSTFPDPKRSLRNRGKPTVLVDKSCLTTYPARSI